MPSFDTPFGQLLFATTLIKCVMRDGSPKQGTGFILDYEAPGGDIPLLVTCKHVVAGANEFTLHLTAQKPDDGSGEPILDLGTRVELRLGEGESLWFPHPDPDVDIAVLPMVPILNLIGDHGIDCYTTSLPTSMIPSGPHLQMIDVREPVVFVGYPYGYMDERHSLPLIRTGYTASHIDLHYNGLPGFYVDGHFHPGSSGSPILILDKIIALNQKEEHVIFEKKYLVGIAASSDPAPGGRYIGQEIGLGFAFNSNMILDTAELYLKHMGVI
ncbi:MAG TPA: serine protease [Fimbriimonadaceae bacterium]|nr:serine protease [Fimbriimonadaceae bacterium]